MKRVKQLLTASLQRAKQYQALIEELLNHLEQTSMILKIVQASATSAQQRHSCCRQDIATLNDMIETANKLSPEMQKKYSNLATDKSSVEEEADKISVQQERLRRMEQTLSADQQW